MAQLLQKNIITIPYTNAVLRNQNKLNEYVILRSDGINFPEFATLSVFKDLILELGKQVSAEFISDACIVINKPGKNLTLNAVENRIILNLENSSVFSINDKRFTPDTGDLVWTNDTITINNSSDNLSLLLIIAFKEFLL